jgi:hypothetical protein
MPKTKLGHTKLQVLHMDVSHMLLPIDSLDCGAKVSLQEEHRLTIQSNTSRFGPSSCAVRFRKGWENVLSKCEVKGGIILRNVISHMVPRGYVSFCKESEEPEFAEFVILVPGPAVAAFARCATHALPSEFLRTEM